MEDQLPVFKLFFGSLWNKYVARDCIQKVNSRQSLFALFPRGKIKYSFWCLFVALMALCPAVMGQNYNILNQKIDSLNRLRLPKSALVEVDKLGNLARQNKNVAQQVKAVIYRMSF